MKKKRYFGRGAMFLLCAFFAVAFLLPTVLTITNSFMEQSEINANYREYQWTWTYKVICDYYGVDSIDDTLADRIHQDYVTARRAWIAEIRKDAEREYRMGDIEDSVLNNFLDKLDHEIDYEN